MNALSASMITLKNMIEDVRKPTFLEAFPEMTDFLERSKRRKRKNMGRRTQEGETFINTKNV